MLWPSSSTVGRASLRDIKNPQGGKLKSMCWSILLTKKNPEEDCSGYLQSLCSCLVSDLVFCTSGIEMSSITPNALIENQASVNNIQTRQKLMHTNRVDALILLFMIFPLLTKIKILKIKVSR